MKTTTVAKNLIHVRTWSGGSQSVRVTDMTNAGKRGKTCRTVHASFTGRIGDDAAGYGEWLHAINDTLPALDAGETSFDDVLTFLRALAGLATIELREETIRGVDAPLAKISTSGPKFTASANEDGVTVCCLVDRANLPQALSRGSNAKAYAIAAKVFPTLRPEMTIHEVVSALVAAGVDMHSYCAMD